MAAAYFVYLAVLACVRSVPTTRRVRALGLSLAAVGAIAVFGMPHVMPLVYLLTGYWLPALLVGAPDTMYPVRQAIPVYSVNIAAVAAVQAALGDLDYLRRYLAEVAESKQLVYAACDRLGMSYFPSRSNFVLVCAGDRIDALVKGAFDRGVYLRDRSTEPGCAGCLRIATGVVEHTRRAVAVMEEVLCAAR